jgi:hypothetical protein
MRFTGRSPRVPSVLGDAEDVREDLAFVIPSTRARRSRPPSAPAPNGADAHSEIGVLWLHVVVAVNQHRPAAGMVRIARDDDRMAAGRVKVCVQPELAQFSREPMGAIRDRVPACGIS